MTTGHPPSSKTFRARVALGAGALVVAVAGLLLLPVHAAPQNGLSWPSLKGDPTPTPTPPLAGIYRCRRGAEFHVSPEEATVTVNGVFIGRADDWDDAGGGDTYFFRKDGWYYVKLQMRGYETTWVRVDVEPEAKSKIVKVKLRLPRARRG